MRTNAFLEVADRYYDGSGTTADAQKSFVWYLKAAENGSAKAQYCVGLLYERGEGTAQDSREAVHWFKAAAENGYIDAFAELGQMYANDANLPRDDGKSIDYPMTRPSVRIMQPKTSFWQCGRETGRLPMS
ncbi:tetratricopeptide repeat protein [Rhizobium leguminosarum]|uniref:tetratricopeptide repeat protein n=1 Tax=Rhizobium leguminosarum TaxID=384 RepID=UPI0021BC0340|nr:tetratricopeptide repeat protein [Rhizobium leguminosarum]